MSKSIFNYKATDGTPFYFDDYTKLLNFAENLYKEKLTFDEAKKEQIEMFRKINELKKRINEKKGRKNIDNKEKMKNVAKSSEELYRFRNKIINEINKEKGYCSVDLRWIKYPLTFKELEDEYFIDPNLGIDVGDERSVDLKNIGKFINDILSGKTNNKNDAEGEYVKKIKDDADYLESINSDKDYFYV